MNALCLLACILSANLAVAQDSTDSDGAELARIRGKSSPIMLRAFGSVVAQSRQSVVRFDKEGKEIALGVIVDASGLALSKASELDGAQLSCKLANGRTVAARVVETDPATDIALIQLDANGLKPIQWAHQPTVVGEWVVTPGIGLSPEAIGIISVPARKIPPKRALIGVQMDFNHPAARIGRILPGLGAEKAGLKPGDIIVEVNGQSITNREELLSTLGRFREGQTVDLRVKRDADEIKASIQLAVPNQNPVGRRANREVRMNHFGSELSRRAEDFQMAVQHDTVLQSWQCGGPLLNLDGKAIGLNIARAGRVASYALPSDLIEETLSSLRHQLEAPVSDTKDQPQTEN